MGWIDRYRQAEFRNIKFYIPNVEGQGGRRNVVHELPERDTPFVQDLGRKGRRFSIEAYVIGENYDIQRDSLITVLERKGSGKLIHPYLGSMDVSVIDFSWRENFNELDICRFTIAFVESGSLKFPTGVIDTSRAIQVIKKTALQVIQETFENAYDILSVPRTITQAAIDTVEKAFDTIESAKFVVSSISKFRQDMETIRGKAIALTYDGKELAQNIIESLTFGTDIDDDVAPVTTDNARQNFEDVRKLFDFQATEILRNEDDPANQIALLMQQVSVITAGGLLGIINFTSANEAEALRNIVFEKLDIFLESVVDDDLYNVYYDLRTGIVSDLEERIKKLPVITQYVPIISLPAIVISYDLYGTIDREQDIIDRNNIKHPGFVTGSVPIEVLIDVK